MPRSTVKFKVYLNMYIRQMSRGEEGFTYLEMESNIQRGKVYLKALGCDSFTNGINTDIINNLNAKEKVQAEKDLKRILKELRTGIMLICPADYICRRKTFEKGETCNVCKSKDSVSGNCECCGKDPETELKGCGHKFHKHCIDEWIKVCVDNGNPVSCPNCRAEIEMLVNVQPLAKPNVAGNYAITIPPEEVNAIMEMLGSVGFSPVG